MREYEKMLCVCFLKLDVLLSFNHCRSAPLYTFFPSLLASVLPSHPLASGGALALALAPTHGCACALLRPGPVLLLKVILLAQAQGFGHHLLSLPLAKLLALDSRWPLLLALAC
jgi:hypothetical protein